MYPEEHYIEKHKAEAVAAGLVYIGKSKTGNPNYREYKCKEDHIVDFQVQHVRRLNVKCPVCREARLAAEALASGFELLGESDKGTAWRVYRKNCGCIEDLRISAVKDHKGTGCKICYEKSLHDALERNSLQLIQHFDCYTCEVEFTKCSHRKIVQKAQIFRDNLVCKECLEMGFVEDALSEGLVLNGQPTCTQDTRYRNYTLPCGCERDLRVDHVRASSWCCQKCGDSHFLKPSTVYLVKMSHSNLTWLKIGFAKNVSRRLMGYGFSGDASILFVKSFATGKEAIQYEKSLHKKYRDVKLPKHIMCKFMENGKDECYPVMMQDFFISELQKENYGA